MINYSILDRKIIKISGLDRKNFLQGLITNDINSLTDVNPLIYSLMLTATGNFLYDFFISEYNNEIYLDVEAVKSSEIIKKLSLYKLSSDIELEIIDDLRVIFLDQKINNHNININININYFTDPRSKEIGFRSIVNKKDLDQINNNNFQQQKIEFYNQIRFQLKIPDHNDMVARKSIPPEYGFFNFNCINFNKGCYIGQEVMARIKYKGIIRKKIYLVQIIGANNFEKFDEIIYNNKKVGNILSHIQENNQITALALLKNTIIDEDKDLDLSLNSNQVKIL